jgi:hypothetical protein
VATLPICVVRSHATIISVSRAAILAIASTTPELDITAIGPCASRLLSQELEDCLCHLQIDLDGLHHAVLDLPFPTED